MAGTFISQTRVSPLVSQSSITSGTFAVQAGDTLVAYGMSGTGSTSAPFSINDSQGLTWTKRAEVSQTPSINYAVIWTATVATTGTMSFGLTRPASGPNWSGAVQVWRGVTGIGDANSGQVSAGQPTTSVVTSAAGSAIVMACADNTAIDGSTTYKEADAGTFTPTSGYPIVSLFSYAFYAGYYADAGAAGNKIVGISYPSAQNYSIVAVELKGVSTEILGDASDGYLWYYSPTYATAREGGGTASVPPFDTGGTSIGQMTSGSNYYCMQGYFKFDVSSLTSFISPDLKFYAQFDSAIDREFVLEWRVHNWGATVDLADFAAGSTLAAKSLVASVNTASWPADGNLIPITVDQTALTAAINAAKADDGWLRLVAASAYQRTNSAPSGIEYVGVYTRDLGGTPLSPRLTYALPSGPVVTAELYEGGVFKQFLGTREVTADGVISFNWDAATLAAVSGADVELRLTSDADLDIGAVEWNAFRAIGAPPPPVTWVEGWGAVQI